MRIARKLVLLCAMATVAMAFTASNASAAETVSVINEETGAACNPCTLHVVGESTLDAIHVIPVSKCTDEFVATVNANASGTIIHSGATDVASPGPGCQREQCTVQPANTPKEPWPFTGEETGANVSRLNVNFCLSPPNQMGTKNFCNNAPVAVTEEGTAPEDHRYMFDLNYECTVAGTPVEVEGHWRAENPHQPTQGDQEIEIVHQP